MEIKVSAQGVIQEQTIDISSEVSIIYGLNNSGKTTILRVLNEAMQKAVRNQYITKGEKGELSIYIPTNRIIVREASSNGAEIKTLEDFIQHQKDSYKEYDLYLRQIREQLLKNKVIVAFICSIIEKIFSIKIEDLSARYSDGIENIINIYLNIIWTILWDLNVDSLDEEAFRKVLREKAVWVLIDEIEMFLHVNIQEKLIGSLKEDFPSSSFLLTTHSPLLLTRYRDVVVYEIKQGELIQKGEKLYYEDLDEIYDKFFAVKEIPAEVKEDIVYQIGRAHV